MVQGRLTVFKFEVFRKYKNISHFVTTKQGWISGEKPRFSRKDDYSDLSVLNFRKELAVSGEWKLNQFIFPVQTHSDVVGVVNENTTTEDFDGCDALITNQTGIFLCVQTADCVPILLYDPVKNVAAAIHAGWRGTVSKIVKKTILRMNEKFDCNPINIVAGIGPSIHFHAYEVGHEVVEIIQANFENHAELLKPSLNSGKAFLDLWEANKSILLDSGVPENNIEILGLCTYEHNELFYSARREGINTGRMATCIMLT